MTKKVKKNKEQVKSQIWCKNEENILAVGPQTSQGAIKLVAVRLILLISLLPPVTN